MCRLMAYIGPDITVADVVVRPSRSIIKQSYDARERRNDSSLPFHLGYGNLNGDGFGIGWFPPDGSGCAVGSDRTPCVLSSITPPGTAVFTSITPAWNNENLNRLATKLESGLVFAHVRAAYPGMPVSEQNCHPFQWGRYLFMHNGVVAGFMQIRRALLGVLADAAYNAVQSFHSDSAVSFALFLHHLPDLHSQHPPDVLLRAVQATIATISRIQAEHRIPPSDVSLLNFVVSDGRSLIATRYVSHAAEAPASLYYAEGSGYEREQLSSEVSQRYAAAAKALHGSESMEGVAGARSRPVTEEHDYHLLYSDKGARVCLVASEPVTSAAEDWVEVPANTALVVCRESGGVLNILLSPIAPGAADARQEEVARCLEAVNHAAAFGAADGPLHARHLAHSRSLPNLADSHGGLEDRPMATPADSMDSGAGALATSPSVLPGGTPRHGRPGGGGGGGGAVVSTGEDDRLSGHPDHSVLCLATANGLLFSGGTDGTIKVWTLAGSKCIATLTGHRQPIRRLEVAAGRLFSAGAKHVRVWSLSEGFPCLARLQVADLRGSTKALAVGGDVLYVGGQSCQVSAYRLAPELLDAPGPPSGGAPISADPLMRGPGPQQGSRQQPPPAAYTVPDGAEAAAAAGCPPCGGGGIRAVVGTAQPPCAASPPEHSHCGSITALAVCGPFVFSASSDSTIRVWRAGGLEFVRVLRGHRGSVLALYGGGGVVLSGGRDRLIRVWDVETLVCRRTLGGHTDDVLSLGGISVPLSPLDGADLAALASARSPTAAVLAGVSPVGLALPPAPGSPMSPAVAGASPVSSPRSTVERAVLFVSASADGSVRLWSAKTYSCLRIFCGRGYGVQPPVMSCALTQSIAVGGMSGGVIRLWRTDDVFAAALSDLLGLPAGTDGSTHGGSAAKDHLAAVAAATEGTTAGAPPAKRVRLELPGNLAAAAAAAVVSGDYTKLLSASSSAANLLDCGCLVTPGSAGLQLLSGQSAVPALSASRLERELEKALRTFIRIKTVSADPSLHEECFRGAKFLLRLLESVGCEVKLSQPVEGKNPVVLGRLVADPAKPTVVFYGHYDVQPANEDNWRHDPFELHSVDGWLYGRGTTDNKGPVLAFVYAVKELLEECKSGGTCLPANVVFLIEGEEENGSTGFREAVQQNLRWFEGARLVLISNTLWVGERLPCITYGMRGMISLSIEVRGPQRDLHSGNEGGVFAEPLADLSKVLASLVDSRNSILVPGFYDGVRPAMLQAALPRLEASHEFSLDGYKEHLGVSELTAGSSERDLLNARWCQPSLSVVDVRVGTTEEQASVGHYRFGPTRFSVIPKAAVGKVSIRFVPDQEPGRLADLLAAHIRHEFAKLRSPNSIAVKVHNVGDWWEASPDSPYMRMAERAVEREWGVQPLLVREGGTMPVASSLQKMLGAPALLLPMGQASDSPHLANERIRRLNLLRGKNVVKNILVEVGQGAPSAPQQQQGAANGAR